MTSDFWPTYGKRDRLIADRLADDWGRRKRSLRVKYRNWLWNWQCLLRDIGLVREAATVTVRQAIALQSGKVEYLPRLIVHRKTALQLELLREKRGEDWLCLNLELAVRRFCRDEIRKLKSVDKPADS